MSPHEQPVSPAAAMKSAKTAVIVLGAPRSGTSAVSQMLANVGVFFGRPEDFVDPAVETHNPIFFELQSLNDINDQLLEGIEVSYGDFDYLPEGLDFRAPREVLAKAAEGVQSLIRSQLDGAELIGLKDPRFVFTLPFWDAELKRLGYTPKYVLTTRATEAIVRSNRKVNGCSEEHNHRLEWLSVASAALHLQSKDLLVVDFDQMVSEPLVTAAHFSAWLDLEPGATASAAAGIDPGLLSHRVEGVSSLSGGTTLASIADEYRSFRGLLAQRGFIELLDRRRREVRGLVRALRAAEARRESNVDALFERLDDSRAVTHQLLAGVGEERERLAAMAKLWAERLEEESQSARSLFARRVSDLESAVFDREARIREMDALLNRSQADLGDANQTIAGMKTQLSEQDSRLQRLGSQLDERNAQVREHATALDLAEKRTEEQARQFEAQTDRWASERALLLDELAQLRDQRDRLQDESERLQEESGRLRGELELARRPWYHRFFRVFAR